MTVSIENLLIQQTAKIHDALRVIDRNGLGLAFVVDSDGVLQGVITDGNVRRALMKGSTITDAVASVMTVDCVSLPVSASPQRISEHLNHRIHVIPLLDELGRPVDYASHYRHHRIPVMEPSLTGDELSYVIECLKTNWISSQGPFVKRFEEDFSSYVGAQQAVAVCNGTAALHIAFASLGLKPGDEVIVPDLTFAATINAVLYVGATPVLVDVMRDTWTIDPEDAARRITKRTRAIVPVHLYGQPAEMNEITRIARKHNLYIVEDVAEALGSLYEGEPVGRHSDAAAFSFFGNKIITTGEGGMVTFRDPAVATRARMLRDHGMDPNRRYWHPEVGFNYRLTNLQAAVGVAQLQQIDHFIHRKVEIGRCYRRFLGSTKALRLPVERKGVRNVYWLFSILLDALHGAPKRDDLVRGLQASGIETRPVFHPLHVMPPYIPYAGSGEFPNTRWIAENGLSLPSAVTLKESEIEYVCDRVLAFMKSDV